MKIRSYSGRDAAPLADLYKRSVEQLGAQDYTPEQVEAWAALGPSPERLHELCSDGRTRLVTVDEKDRPIAFVDLEKNGHIHFLYCAPEAAGTGAASSLYGAMEAAARGSGMTRLYSEASEAARRFFLKKDFVVTAKREFEISGVWIHNYAVEKNTDGLGPSCGISAKTMRRFNGLELRRRFLNRRHRIAKATHRFGGKPGPLFRPIL